MHRIAAVCLLTFLFPVHSFRAADHRTIDKEVLVDKIRGGWAGQMFGVVYGAPTEFRARGKMYDAEKVGTPAELKGALDQDDLYVEMTLAEVMDRNGLDATAQDYGELFRDSKYRLWHANLAARRNLSRGINPPLSGDPRNNAHANDIDFQIESDFIGLMSPGLPKAVQFYGDRVGHVMNYGDGVYGGVFIGAMYAAAFFENEPRAVVEAGLEAIPAQSQYAAIIRDVLAWHKENPKDWKAAWQRIEDKWDKDDPCPEGALTPFNIDAKLNGAYIALGLLYGKGDFGQTIEISTRAGQDSDCNPASSGGILGVVLGYERIPEEWKGGIAAIANEKFRYTDFSFNTIVESTQKRAIGLVQRHGGRVEGDRLLVRVQTPKPTKLETWKFGTVAERIGAEDSRWTFSGPWRTEKTQRIAAAKGAELTVTFEGAGAILVGPYLAEGGKADVYLDGKLDRTVDVCSDEKGDKRGDSVWHAFGLKPGKHTVRLVVRGEPYGDRKGTNVALESLVVFR